MELADRGLGESCLLLAQGRAEQGDVSLGASLEPGRLEVGPEPAVKVVADGDLALLAALFPEPQNALGPLVLEVPSPQPGDGADRWPRCRPGCPSRARSRRPTTCEVSIEPSRSRAWGMDRPGVLPSEVSCLRPRTDWNGIQGSGVAGDQECRRNAAAPARAWFLVELSPGRSSMKRPARPGETWGSSSALILAPGEEAPHARGHRRGGCGDWRCERRRTHRRQTAPGRRRARGRPAPIGPDRGLGRRAEGRFGQGIGP